MPGYTALQRQLNGLGQKLADELEGRIEQYLGGVRIMESGIVDDDGIRRWTFHDGKFGDIALQYMMK